MTLNCKQGDLAIIVKSTCGNEGKIVRCLELLHTEWITDVNGVRRNYVGGGRYVWCIDRTINFKSLRTGYITQMAYCSDAYLRPLRGDLDDETIEEENELSTHV